MNSKTITLIAVFAALTIALNLSPFKFPAPFLPFLYYQIWEIPIMAAFLLFGPLVGFAISIINTIVLLIIFPGSLPTGPLYNLAAVLSMLFGSYIVILIAIKGNRMRSTTRATAFSTALGSFLRVSIMTIVNWTLLRYPPPLGYSVSEGLLMAWLPLIGVFNLTLALYTVPLGHFLTRVVSARTKIKAWAYYLETN